MSQAKSITKSTSFFTQNLQSHKGKSTRQATTKQHITLKSITKKVITSTITLNYKAVAADTEERVFYFCQYESNKRSDDEHNIKHLRTK